MSCRVISIRKMFSRRSQHYETIAWRNEDPSSAAQYEQLRATENRYDIEYDKCSVYWWR